MGPGCCPSSHSALHLGPAGLCLRPQCSHRGASSLAYNLSTRGGGTISSSRSPGSNHTTQLVLIWGSGSENPAMKARRGREARRKRTTGLVGRKKGGLTSDLDMGGVRGHHHSKVWLEGGRTLRKDHAPGSSSRPGQLPHPESGPGWPMGESGEDTGRAGLQPVSSVGHTGRASQLHSRTGPGRGKTA